MASSGSGLLPENGVRGHAPPSAFGRAAASPQTRQMRCWPSSERTTNPSSRRKRQDSLTPLHRLLPTETASLGFGGSPVGGGDKNSRVIFFTFLCGGYHLPSGCCGYVGTTPRGVYFGRKTAFSEWVLCADERAVPSCTQRFFGTSMRGVVSLPSACASCR